jgi:hypothetical protein
MVKSEHPGKGSRQRGLTQSGEIFQKQMAFGQQTRHRQLNLLTVTHIHPADFIDDACAHILHG